MESKLQNEIKNCNNKRLLDSYYKENKIKKIKLYELEAKVNKLKEEINNTDKKIQKVCEHNWERTIVYGERTSYECLKCGLYR